VARTKERPVQAPGPFLTIGSRGSADTPADPAPKGRVLRGRQLRLRLHVRRARLPLVGAGRLRRIPGAPDRSRCPAPRARSRLPKPWRCQRQGTARRERRASEFWRCSSSFSIDRPRRCGGLGSCAGGCRDFGLNSLVGGKLPRPFRRGSEVFYTTETPSTRGNVAADGGRSRRSYMVRNLRASSPAPDSRCYRTGPPGNISPVR
jgi:hypothetical protein